MHLGLAKTPFFHFHLTAKSANGMRLQILNTHEEFQFSTQPNIYAVYTVMVTTSDMPGSLHCNPDRRKIRMPVGFLQEEAFLMQWTILLQAVVEWT